MLCRLCRNILADKPRVTRFPVDFDAVTPAPQADGLQLNSASTSQLASDTMPQLGSDTIPTAMEA